VLTTKQLVDILRDKYDFQLGGSRRINEKFPNQIYLTEETDWDLYCADTPENIKILAEFGFELFVPKRVLPEYVDNLFVALYKHKKYNIEVITRRHVGLYGGIFENLTLDEFVDKIWKSSPTNKSKNVYKFRQQVKNLMNDMFETVCYEWIAGYSKEYLKELEQKKVD